MFSLKGKYALITGATGVLGSVMSHALADAGANVVLIARKTDTLKKLAGAIAAKGGKALFLEADVTRTDELEAAYARLRKETESLDIIVNAAGGNLPGATVPDDKSFFDVDAEAIRKVMDLNFMGTVLPTKTFGRMMLQSKSGSVINISSMASIRPLTRVMGYGSAKAAIDNFTQWLAVEMAAKYGEGIRVNAIAPGFFLTEQNRTLLTNTDGALTERGKKIIAQTPFKRFGSPEELTGTLLWLSSDASKFVTGTVVPVDGGFNAFSGV
jgi:NAD(P)-dependent dehydrogenase (short-subunit alcohol dehydrogenase family)